MNEICYKQCPVGFNLTCENCYYKCKNCFGFGDEFNNNCSECFEGMILLKDDNKSNCYKKCPNYYYFAENGSYICTETSECPKGYHLLNQNEKKCVKNSEKVIDTTYMDGETSDFIGDIKTSNISKDNYKKEIAKKDEEMKNFKKDMLNNKEVLDNAKKGEDYIKKDDDMLFQVTTSDNQKNNTNKSISSIDLKDCEDRLRAKYDDIPKNMPLIIIKIDCYSKDNKIPIIEKVN